VKDGLLQACVLLTTQGDNSRIRRSATQERQHVLSADIRPYFKKLLDTSPALLQEVALPAIFMLRNVSTLAPGFEAGVRLLQAGRRPSTVMSYDQKWLKFVNFTVQLQDDAGAPRMSALPASSQAVVAYLGYLLESGTISAKSLQPYMSAINAVYNDFEYPPPACGHLVKLARKGFAELQGSSMLHPQHVTVFPAEHMFTIVMYDLRPNASRHRIRVCACLASQLAFFSRADSGVLLTAIMAQVSDSTLSIYRTQYSRTLFESVLSSSRSRQLLQQAPLKNATEPPRHIFTGSFNSILCHRPQTRASLPSGCCSSCWNSTFQPLQELHGPVILYVEVPPLHRTPSACRLQSS
jgi:hypothetical protein